MQIDLNRDLNLPVYTIFCLYRK